MNKRTQVIVATKRYEWKKILENKHYWVNSVSLVFVLIYFENLKVKEYVSNNVYNISMCFCCL